MAFVYISDVTMESHCICGNNCGGACESDGAFELGVSGEIAQQGENKMFWAKEEENLGESQTTVLAEGQTTALSKDQCAHGEDQCARGEDQCARGEDQCARGEGQTTVPGKGQTTVPGKGQTTVPDNDQAAPNEGRTNASGAFVAEQSSPLQHLSNVELLLLKEYMGLKDRVGQLETKLEALKKQMDKLLCSAEAKHGILCSAETKQGIPSVRIIALKELEAYVIESVTVGDTGGHGVSKKFVKSYLHTEKGINWTVHYQKRLNLVLRELVEKNVVFLCPDTQLYRLM